MTLESFISTCDNIQIDLLDTDGSIIWYGLLNDIPEEYLLMDVVSTRWNEKVKRHVLVVK